ncbi:MAG TPA: hypothetical protein VFC26_01665 [Verrucomicrobiae bacterium]|nr:hypothetical protein [Verrucomicrobiae bacterium]
MKTKKNGKGAKSHKRSHHQSAQVQPEPVTPGITKAMVRQHAYELYRDKLAHGSLTLGDWVLAEKDLVAMQERGELLER